MNRLYRLFGWLPTVRNRHFFFIDFVAFMITPTLAFVLRLEGMASVPALQDELIVITFLFAFIKIVTFQFTGLYRSYWQQASVDEMAKIVGVGLVATLAETIFFTILSFKIPLLVRGIPFSVPIIDGIFTMIAIGGSRFSLRFSERIHQRVDRDQRTPVVIIGAGDTGIIIAHEMQANASLGMNPVAFIDDDPNVQNLIIRGIPVMGNREKIGEIVAKTKAEQIIICIPSASGKEIRGIVNLCKSTNIVPRIMPGVNELIDGSISASRLRKIEIDDLLRRDPIQTNFDEVRGLLHGKRVLVTGAGGSIGSEICRQVMRCAPGKIILLGHGENSIYNIALELGKKYSNAAIQPVIADVRDYARLLNVMRTYSPEIIIHTAAHKHVHLMEANIEEAVSNNIGGTYNLIKLAHDFKVERFLFISTDKAVNPTSIMGSTKRIAELIVQNAANRTGKPYIVVRFGNVLGSRGSVVPLFNQQIAQGGPVTVTDPEVKRYFMTIPEAVQLVLQATTIGKGGEVFVLDMGEPIRIVDLARDMIRLSGLNEGKDIDIVYTGLRPGEKTFEELLIHDETMAPTSHKKIFVCRNGAFHPRFPDGNEDVISPELNEKIFALQQASKKGSDTEIHYLLRDIVPEFQSTNHHLV